MLSALHDLGMKVMRENIQLETEEESRGVAGGIRNKGWLGTQRSRVGNLRGS